jgi:uncharacterized repeat protein (TIGR01451 family)
MKNTTFYRQFLILAILITIILTSNISFAQSNTNAGVTISNFAEASYKNAEGIEFNAVSLTLTVTIKAISSLVVTPDDSESSAVIMANESIARKFQVCNNGNISDTYKLTRASVIPPAQIRALYFDADNNGVVSDSDVSISLNATQSPLLPPGECLNVLAEINTNSFPLGELLNINITVRSNNTDTANGPVEDSGTIINSVGKAVTFTNPNDPTLIPSKLIENHASYVADKNQPLNYSISFRNNGDVVAKNVVISDDLPSQLNYVANSLRLDGHNLTDNEDNDQGSVVGRLLTVRLAQPVAPGQIVRLTFQAIVTANQKPGTGIINVAKIGASNAPTVDTSQAIAVVDPFGTVYAARGGVRRFPEQEFRFQQLKIRKIYYRSLKIRALILI